MSATSSLLLRILNCILFFTVFILGIWNGLALAQATPDEFWADFKEDWSPRVDIHVKGSHYPENSQLKPAHNHLSGNATIGMSRFLSDRFMVQVDPRVNFDTLHTAGARLFVEDREGIPAFTFNQAYLGWFGDTVELYAGKKIYSWKVADAYSPLDTLNPRDIMDPADSEKIGVPSVSLMKLLGRVSVQVVWLPFFVPDRLPDNQDRWAGDDLQRRQAFYNQFGVWPTLGDAGRDLTAHDRTSVAARLLSCDLIPGWDLALVFRHGPNTRGVIRNDITPFTFPRVSQTTEYPVYNLFGASFSTTAGPVEFHGEAAFHDSRDNVRDEDFLLYIGGVNYTRHDVLTCWLEEIRFSAEYAGQEITRRRPIDSIYSDQSAVRGMTANLMGSIQFKINEDHLVKGAYSYNTANEDAMGDLYWESRLTDNLKLTIGYQMLSGDPDSFFGQWSTNDRIYIETSITY